MSEPRSVVLLLIRDLIFETRIRSTADALGKSLIVTHHLADFTAAIDRDPPQLVIVDLDSALDDGIGAVSRAAASPRRPDIVAFGSHVAVDRAEAARQAGASRVLPRSRFTIDLPAILDGVP